MKKILSTILAVLLMISVMPTGLLTVPANAITDNTTEFAGGSEANTYTVEAQIKEFVEKYGVPLYNWLDSFNGTPTEKNIDYIIFLSFYFSGIDYYLPNTYTKAEVEKIVDKHFIVNNLDLSLSSRYNAQTDTYKPLGSGFGGASVFEPTIIQYENIFDVTIPYILAGEEDITGNLFLEITKELKIVRFCVEHTFTTDTANVCKKCGCEKGGFEKRTFAGGSGTESTPYLIATKKHLNNVRNDLNAHYKMITDIVFSDVDFSVGGNFYNDGSGWTPIGSGKDSPFTGSFNGNNYTITGLQSNVFGIGDLYVGLFGYCEGTIFDLELTDVNITGTITGSENSVWVGGICGYLASGIIESCRVSGTVSAYETCAESQDKSKAYAGGIAGESNNGSFALCVNSAQITAQAASRDSHSGGGSYGTFAYAGGIVSKTTGTISKCYNIGNINGQSTGVHAQANAGGITARSNNNISMCYNTGMIRAIGNPNNGAAGIAGSYSTGTLSNCYNTGYITSDGNVAGIVEYLSSGTVSNVYNIGAISGYSSYYVRAIIADAYSGTVKNCYYANAKISGIGRMNDTSIRLTFDAAQQQSSYTGFDFSSVWKMCELSDHPYPELRELNHTTVPQPENTTEFFGGTGSYFNPFKIANKEHLNNVRKYPSAYFVMVEDIEFFASDFEENGEYYNDGAGWDPIGTSSLAFTGTFDGNGHMIKGLYVNIVVEHGDVYAGLFGINSGTIKNLGLANSQISASVIGTNSNYVCIAYAGGIVGENNGLIEKCYNTGNVSAFCETSQVSAGGIAGGIGSGNIKNCFNTGHIKAHSNGESHFGYAYGIGTGNTFENCYNTGVVEAIAAHPFAAGITNHASSMVSCYYLDNIENGSGSSIDNCTKCTLESMTKKETFVGFDFENIWEFRYGNLYPYPTLRSTPYFDGPFEGGSGTEEDPYLIKTAQQLNRIRNYLDAHYKMTSDIIFSEEDFAEDGAFYNGGNGWLPIGTPKTPFTGSFDGKGYCIKGLQITSGVEGNTYIGLFGYADGSAISTIKNVNAVDFQINISGDSISTSSSYSYVYAGTIVGYGSANNCTSSGEINFEYSSTTRKTMVYIGGVVGDGSVINCANRCNITANIASGSSQVSFFVGGVVGRGYNVSQCYNYGTLYAYSKRNWYSYIEAGGIASFATSVDRCGNSGNITGGGYGDVNHVYVGGIIARGMDTTTTVDQCYNMATIKGEREEYTGGIVGYLGNNSRITNSFNAGAILNGLNGGISGYCSNGTRISNCYNVGYIENGYGITFNKSSDATFENCYCLEGMATNRDYVTVCTNLDMRTQDIFEGFDFDNIWQIGHNNHYQWPELQTVTVKNLMVDISNCVVSLAPTKISYHDMQPDFSVSYNGEVLTINEDYIAFFIVGDKTWRVQTASKQLIRDVGIGKLIIIGIGDFCYTTTYEFNIEKYDMTNASLWTQWIPDESGESSSSTWFSLENFTYDGTEKVQSGFRVKDGYDTIDPSKYEITYRNNIEAGTATMIITGKGDYYTGTLEKTFIIYAPTVESLSITQKPNKLTYIEGEKFDPSGLVVTAYYNNGTCGIVADYTVSGYTSTVGTKTITVSYGGKSATFTVVVNSRVPSTLTSAEHTISGNYISKITAGTTISQLLNGINEGEYCKVYKDNEEVEGDIAVGTGMVVKIMDGSTVKAEYTIIVTGDTNGDGNITITDMIAIKAHVLEKTLLGGVYATAADTSGDGKISLTDFIQVKSKILGKSEIVAR